MKMSASPVQPLLGVNIDHIATLRQLRGTPYPDLVEAAAIVERAGGNQITIHLREDRRHIQDEDVKRLRKLLTVPMNLEMAVTEAMTRFAVKWKPDWACLVPEKRQEVTTEGGLDVKKGRKKIAVCIGKLKKAGIQVSLFIEPSVDSVQLSHALGADAVELHTGRYCLATQSGKSAVAKKELERIRRAALLCRKLGMKCHAGHGFDFENVRPVAELVAEDGAPLIREYNIGHAIVCRAAIVGLERAVREMVSAIRAP